MIITGENFNICLSKQMLKLHKIKIEFDNNQIDQSIDRLNILFIDFHNFRLGNNNKMLIYYNIELDIFFSLSHYKIV